MSHRNFLERMSKIALMSSSADREDTISTRAHRTVQKISSFVSDTGDGSRDDWKIMPGRH